MPHETLADASRAKPRILYVDDDAQHLHLYSTTLRDEFEVITVGSPEQGLKVLEEQGPFAVVLSDMRMPRMSGADFLSRVRRLDARAIRILMTGDADLESAAAAVNQAFAFRYLTKPCSRAALIQALRLALNEHERELQRDGLSKKLELLCPKSPAEIDEACIGQLIGDRYRVQSVLGSGGTAVVFGCWDTLLEVEVALKLFAKNLDVTAQERVRRELVLTRQLSHHNILRCYDIGTHAGSPFITMEVLRGGSLRDKIGKPELTTRLALHCLLQACAGLGHAHEMGVTHRDVKPDNLLLCDDGVLHVMDFGLAKQDTGSHLTQPSMVGGTLQYIAPEQIRDLGSANHLADIYALGAVAYELLTGRAPFDFDDPKIVVASHLMIDPPPPSARNPALSSELDAIVLTAMAKEPAHRYQTCAQLSRALERELAKL